MLWLWGYLNTLKTLCIRVVSKLLLIDWWLSYDIDLCMYVCMTYHIDGLLQPMSVGKFYLKWVKTTFENELHIIPPMYLVNTTNDMGSFNWYHWVTAAKDGLLQPISIWVIMDRSKQLLAVVIIIYNRFGLV